MEELARRINRFFVNCPKEASAFFEQIYDYQYEMEERRQDLGILIEGSSSTLAMIAAFAQTIPGVDDKDGECFALLPLLEDQNTVVGVHVVEIPGGGPRLDLN